jgi:uncharacterized pyridoxamine 5'-phosphate oxidase family protein
MHSNQSRRQSFIDMNALSAYNASSLVEAQASGIDNAYLSRRIYMKTAYEYLKANPVFHFATVDGTKARVRPFGFTMIRNKALYLCTNKTKEVFKQFVANPDVEISCMGTDGTWLRIRGKVAVDESRDAKVQAFKEGEMLLQIYPKGADDEVFVTFYFTEAQATLFSFTGAPASLPLV